MTVMSRIRRLLGKELSPDQRALLTEHHQELHSDFIGTFLNMHDHYEGYRMTDGRFVVVRTPISFGSRGGVFTNGGKVTKVYNPDGLLEQTTIRCAPIPGLPNLPNDDRMIEYKPPGRLIGKTTYIAAPKPVV